MELPVYNLEKFICYVRCEGEWSGRRLKEAIEEASEWKELVCTQMLAIGHTFIQDDQGFAELLVEGATVSLTRRPWPLKVLRPAEDAKAFACALRAFECPVLLEIMSRGPLIFSADPEGRLQGDSGASSDEDDGPMIKLETIAMNRQMLESWIPWEAFGVAPSQIAVVLALQATFHWVGDGLDHLAALLLLTDGTLLAVAGRLEEAARDISYDNRITFSSHSAKTAEQMWKELPNFTNSLFGPVTRRLEWSREEAARHEVPIGPPQVAVQVVTPAWTTAEHLTKWEEENGMIVRGRGEARFPARPWCRFVGCDHPAFAAMAEIREVEDSWRRAASRVSRDLPIEEGLQDFLALLEDRTPRLRKDKLSEVCKRVEEEARRRTLEHLPVCLDRIGRYALEDPGAEFRRLYARAAGDWEEDREKQETPVWEVVLGRTYFGTADSGWVDEFLATAGAT
ncbi:unnamed protein product [Effrenium voratum]|uniref:Uncharacterized protein n=2 Tax=Effrenium voratum TaxID=2562239 RepID=A0AA36I7R5_9DINO|nr:unnamed protein product [Effrenium voratum]CAJ1414759.1 unnamed protein product [Effrenium voratum]